MELYGLPRHSRAHSCKYCQRIVICREHFLSGTSRIRLPHKESEVLQAMKDNCALMMSLLGLGWQFGAHPLEDNFDQLMRQHCSSWLKTG